MSDLYYVVNQFDCDEDRKPDYSKLLIAFEGNLSSNVTKAIAEADDSYYITGKNGEENKHSVTINSERICIPKDGYGRDKPITFADISNRRSKPS